MRLLRDYFRQNQILVVFFIIQIQALIFSVKSLDIPTEYEVPAPIKPTADNDTKREGRSWRLPSATYPLKYHLHITTWIHQAVFDFNGNVTIELLVKENTSELIIHAVDLKINEILLEDLTTLRKYKNIKYRQIDDLLVIEQSENNYVSTTGDSSNDESNAIESNGVNFERNHRLRLEIHYTGVINKHITGFHTTSYEDVNNQTVYAALTQMEPVWARNVLPCYDEPGLKAHFTVRITHGSNYTAISNMPALSTVEHSEDKMTTTNFMETPPMCTYLLAFVISNYEFIAVEYNGTLHRAFAPSNSKVHGDLALANAVTAIATFAEYMDMPFQLPKLDHIFVRDCYGLAMENWGLIIYKEAQFKQDYAAKRFTDIIYQNHELIHQWFGNLVSPAWWDSVWLSEGMTTYYSYKLTNMLYPDEEDTQMDYCSDRYGDEHLTVSVYVEKPEDILKAFGAGNYKKAPCLIRMFDHAFGPDFHKGVQNFLKSHAFSNANEEQFFEHIQNALLNSTNKSWTHNVHEIMKPWFHAQALPKVYITRGYNDSGIIYIEQKPDYRTDSEGELWWIPLNFVTASQPNFENTEAVYYMPPTPKVTLNLTEFNITLGHDDWLLANINQIGYYRVFYDAENLLRIFKALQTNHHVIGKIHRMQIFQTFAFSWPEQLSTPTILESFRYLPQEEDLAVWSLMYTLSLGIEEYLACSRSIDLYQDYMRNIFAPQYHKYVMKLTEELSPIELSEWRNMKDLACHFNLGECTEDSKEKVLLNKEKFFEAKVPYELQFDLCNAAKSFSNDEFDETLQLLLNTTGGYYRYLRCTSSIENYEKWLQVWLDQRIILNEDDLYLVTDNLGSSYKKWDSNHKFLKKAILKLQNDRNSTINLCEQLSNRAPFICKSKQKQYMELYNLCSEQLLKYDVITDEASELELGTRVGIHNNREWELEDEQIYNFLKQENLIYYSKY